MAGDSFTAGFMYGLWSWKPLTLRNNAEKNNDEWTIEVIEEGMRWMGDFACKCHCYDTWSKYSIPPHIIPTSKSFLDEAKEPEYPVFEKWILSIEFMLLVLQILACTYWS